jgi:hypothetical protein
MTNINAISMVRKIRDKQYKETKDLKGAELKKYYSEKAKWAKKPKKATPVKKD